MLTAVFFRNGIILWFIFVAIMSPNAIDIVVIWTHLRVYHRAHVKSVAVTATPPPPRVSLFLRFPL